MKDWPTSTLGEVCRIRTGKKDVNQGSLDGEFPFFTCAQKPSRSDSYSFDTEAILVAGNGNVGQTNYYDGKFEAYQRTYVLSDFVDANARYINYLLDSKLGSYLAERSMGNTIPYIKLGMLTNFPIPLPPLDEQKRIVAKLDAVSELAQSYASINSRKRELNEQFRNSSRTLLFLRAQAVGQNWELGEIVQIKGGKRLPKGSRLVDHDTGYPYITVSDFNERGTVDSHSVRFITAADYAQIKQYTISTGDIYVSIAGTIGKSGVIPQELEGANLTENACKLIPGELVLKDYLYWFTRSEIFRQATAERTRTSAQPKLALNRLKSVVISVPPIEIQRKIADQCQLMALACDRYQLGNKEHRLSIVNFRDSIIAAAFAGEL